MVTGARLLMLLPMTAGPVQIMPKIVIDSREQKVYEFRLPSVIAALPTGDYSIVGYESVFAVERKELSDLIGCITGSRDRFERELSRASTMKRLFVVIEAEFLNITKHQYRSTANPESIIGSLAAWACRYDSVHFLFAGNREGGQRLTEKLLLRSWKEYQKMPSSRTGSEVIE